MNTTELFDRFREAAKTCKRLPPIESPRLCQPSHQFVTDAKEAYGYNEVKLVIRPTGEQIDRMDETLTWLQMMDQEVARIVWAKANNSPWHFIGRMLGMDPRTAQRRMMAGLYELAEELSGGGVV